MIRTISLLLAGVLVVPTCAWAQNAPSASLQVGTNAAYPTAATPSDPTALMVQAARLNGLAGVLAPWHLEATYQTFDADGKPKDQGTFSEWWAGKDTYKTVYTSAASDLNLTIYRYGKTSASTGIFRVDSLSSADGATLPGVSSAATQRGGKARV